MWFVIAVVAVATEDWKVGEMAFAIVVSMVTAAGAETGRIPMSRFPLRVATVASS
jgi:hypothetical protein